MRFRTSSAETRSRSPVGSSATRRVGIGDDGAGDRHPLLFSARKLTRVVTDPVVKIDQPEGHQRMLPSFFFRKPGQMKGKLHVLNRCEDRDEIVELKDEAHMSRPATGQVPFRRGS